MDTRTLELTLISAKDLKNVRKFANMDVYVLVTISGDPNGTYLQKSPVHKGGGTSPEWNYTMKFTISESAARKNRSVLEFTLRCERRAWVDEDIGIIQVNVKELLHRIGDSNTVTYVKYPVKTISGSEKGELNFSCKLCNSTSTTADAHFASSSQKFSTHPAGYPPPNSAPKGYPPRGYSPTGYYPASTTVEKPVYPPMGYPAPTSPGVNPMQQAGYRPGGYAYRPPMMPPKRSQSVGMAGMLAPLLMAGFIGAPPALDPAVYGAFDPAVFGGGYDFSGAAFAFDPSAYAGGYDLSGGQGAFQAGSDLGGAAFGSFPFSF